MSGAPFGQQYGQAGVQQMGTAGVNGQQLQNKTALSNNLPQFSNELKGSGSVPNMVSVKPGLSFPSWVGTLRPMQRYAVHLPKIVTTQKGILIHSCCDWFAKLQNLQLWLLQLYFVLYRKFYHLSQRWSKSVTYAINVIKNVWSCNIL